MSLRPILPALVAGLILSAAPAQAYIGPGAGAGTIAVVLGVIAAIFMAFFAVLWYPIKRMFKKRKADPAAPSVQDTPEGPDGA